MRIGHFSDVHLLSLKGASWVDFLSKRWIGGLNLLASRSRHHRAEIFEAMVEDFNRGGVDHLIATGDITNVALEGEFHFAREKFDKIELGPGEVTVIPGNHDAYVEEGNDHFEAIFADYCASDSGWDDELWPSVRIRDEVAIIGLSTSKQTPWFTAYGRVGPEQLERLDAILADDRLAGLFRLVAVHHPPVGHRAERKIRGLRDHTDLAAVLERRGAELVLHGHEHEDLEHELPGPDSAIPVRCIQSGSYESGDAARRARYRVFDVERRAGAPRPSVVGESLRVWDPGSEAFVDDAPEVVQVAEPA